MQILWKLPVKLSVYAKDRYSVVYPVISKCPCCNASVRLRRHGFYKRNVLVNNKCFRIDICRYRCPSCLKTILSLAPFSPALFPTYPRHYPTEPSCSVSKAIVFSLPPTIYLSNLAELAKKQSDELILKNNENKDLKYRYQTNTNVLVGSLKDKLVLMMLEKSVRKRHKIFKQIIKTISKSVTPVREGRSYKRKYRKVMGKYNPNHRRCL